MNDPDAHDAIPCGDGATAELLVPSAGEGPSDAPPPIPDRDPFVRTFVGDARRISAHITEDSVDLIVTSPPYWRKRDYGVKGQIGQESTPDDYVEVMVKAMRDWSVALKASGSVFLNIGDTYHKRSLAGVPARLEAAAADDGWIVRNRIIWAKTGGMPEPARNRLAPRHEYVIHFVRSSDYYYDLYGYSAAYGNGSNPGDIWQVSLERDTGRHLAPFPEEIVERAITLACPYAVCTTCGTPVERVVERTAWLDTDRPQARRAVELAHEHNLTPEHIAAIQATGISDAGKAKKYQNGTGRNSARVKHLAKEAKDALGGYFREFTFAKRVTTNWTRCDCGGETKPGVVLDPFLGTGTAATVALRMGRSAYGIDLDLPKNLQTSLAVGAPTHG